MRRRHMLAGLLTGLSGCLNFSTTENTPTPQTATPLATETATKTATEPESTPTAPEPTPTDSPQTLVNESPTPGKLAWTYDISGDVQAGPAIGTDRVFLGTDYGRFIALDKATGKLEWDRSIDGGFGKRPLVTDSGVITAADKYYCFDRKSGDIRWEYTGSGGLNSVSPTGNDTSITTYGQDILIIDDLGGKVARVNRSNGSERWYTEITEHPDIPDASNIQSRRCLFDESTPVVPFKDLDADRVGFLRFDVETGEPTSITMAEAITILEPAIVDDGVIVGLDSADSIVALDIETGELLWRKSSEIKPNIMPAPNGVLLSWRPGSSSNIAGPLTLLNTRSGTPIWDRSVRSCCHRIRAAEDGVFWTGEEMKRLGLDDGEVDFSFEANFGVRGNRLLAGIDDDLLVGYGDGLRAIWRENA